MTSQEASAYWQALQRAVSQVHVVRRRPDWRRRRAGEMRVTHTERLAMQAWHLMTGESYTALAKRFRRDRHYMPRWIWTPEYSAFFSYYWGDEHDERSARSTGRSAKAAATDERTATT